MKQESVTELSNFELEIMRNNKCKLIFNELVLVEEVERQEEGEEQTRYIYNTYVLETNYRVNLEQDVRENYSAWLNFAKEQEYNKLAQEVRKKRDKLLQDTDWTQATDSPLLTEVKEQYRVYRQELRDITEQEEFPYNVEFPNL